jgi:hypothetical protein
MNSKGFPYVSSYQSYFSYEANLHLFDPIISDMVSERFRCASRCSDHEDEDFAYEDEDKESVSDCDDEVLSEDEECSSKSLHQASPFQAMEDGCVSQMMKKTTYVFPGFSKQQDSILESGVMECKHRFDLPQLFSGVTVNSSIKIDKITDSRTTEFLFPTPSLIRFSCFKFEKLVSATMTILPERVSFFYHLRGVYIKVFDPGGNFCDSPPSLLSSSVCISSVSVSIFVFNSNGNRLCSLLRLFREGGSALVFDPGVFDPGGIFVMFSSTVTSESNTKIKNNHVLKSRFWKAILVEDFRGRDQSYVSGYYRVSKLFFA